MTAAPRTTNVRAGDSLRVIALRELGDAMRWGEIARLNELRPPYITPTTDPAERARGTAIWGDTLLIPRGYAETAPLEPDVLYGRDVALDRGSLSPKGGDWDLVEGEPNLGGALVRRTITPTGDLLPHPAFGCDAHKVLGFKLKPIAVILGAGHIKNALLADPRVHRVIKIEPDEDGDVARYVAEIIPIHGTKPLDINLVLPWSVV